MYFCRVGNLCRARCAVLLILVGCWPTQEAVLKDSCAANGDSSQSCKLDGAGVVPAQYGSIYRNASTRAKNGIIQQEIHELQQMVGRCRARIKLLEELRAISAGAKWSARLPHVSMLNEKMPLLSGTTVDETVAPTCSSGDFYISKAVVPLDSEAIVVKFLPLRNSRTNPQSTTSQVPLPSSLLVVIERDGIARLFTSAGDLVLAFSTGHTHPVELLATSPSQDEYLVITSDTASVVRVHKISVRHRRAPTKKKQRLSIRMANQERNSPYLGLQFNVTAQFHKQLRWPNSTLSIPSLTCLSMTSQQGTKHFVAGDSAGYVTIWARNGTLRAQLDTMPSNFTGARVAVDSISVHVATVLYRAGGAWGLIDLESLKLRRYNCSRFQGTVTSAVIDTQNPSKLVVADERGVVWVLEIHERRECKVAHRFRPGVMRAPFEIASLRSYAVGLETRLDHANLVMLNMSHVGKRKHELAQYPSPVVWRRSRPPVRSWAVFKRYQQGDLVAFLSADGHQIEVAEILMTVYQAPTADNFNYLKAPVIGVGVLGIIGYQYSRAGGLSPADEAEFGKMVKHATGDASGSLS